nr:hypothetical protein Iba_scaffold51369CG0160 [Ipomoea batatas]
MCSRISCQHFQPQTHLACEIPLSVEMVNLCTQARQDVQQIQCTNTGPILLCHLKIEKGQNLPRLNFAAGDHRGSLARYPLQSSA